MENVKGTTGYSSVAKGFITATVAMNFKELHRPYLELIPTAPSRVLDVGAGAGRDASVFASMGHSVTAVEPMPEFLTAARKLHNSPNIRWVDDSLPDLSNLDDSPAQFDFVLASAVWHHLDDSERVVAMSRIAELTRRGGTFALSLRNGPAGGGTHVFPTDLHQTTELAKNFGFESVVSIDDQPSLMAGKSKVKWSMLALKRL